MGGVAAYFGARVCLTPTLPFSTLVVFPLVYFEQAADGQILGGLLCPRSLSLHEVTQLYLQLEQQSLRIWQKTASGRLQEGKIDGDGGSLPISGHSHLLVQTVELLFVGLPLHLSCLAPAALQNLDLVVEVAQAHHRVDLLRTQQAQVGEGGLDVVDEPLYQPLAPVHEHLYDVPVLDLRASGSHRAVVGQVAAGAEGQQLGIVEEALVEAILGCAAADPNDEAIILENVSSDPEFGEAGREGFCSNDLVEIFAILQILDDAAEAADAFALGEVLLVGQERIVLYLDLESEQLDNPLVVSLYLWEVVGVDDVVKGFNFLFCLRLQGFDLLSEGLIVALHGLVQDIQVEVDLLLRTSLRLLQFLQLGGYLLHFPKIAFSLLHAFLQLAPLVGQDHYIIILLFEELADPLQLSAHQTVGVVQVPHVFVQLLEGGVSSMHVSHQ